jgi:hypothetical protein
VTVTPTPDGITVTDPIAIPFNFNKPYWLEAIACNDMSDASGAAIGAMCAVNTIGTSLYAVEILFATVDKLNEQYKQTGNVSPVNVTFETYEKFPGYDGESMFIDELYIVHRAFSLKSGGGLSAETLIYSRNTKSKYLHTQVEIDY